MQRRTRTHNYRRAMDWQCRPWRSDDSTAQRGLHHSECTLLMLNVYNKWGGVNSSILLAYNAACFTLRPNSEEST